MKSISRSSVAAPAACRLCGRTVPHHVTEQGTRLSVFFIPVWTFGRAYRSTCTACGGQVRLGRRQAAALGRHAGTPGRDTF